MSKETNGAYRIPPYYERTFTRHKKDLQEVESGLRDDIRFNKKLGYAYVVIIEQLKHFEGELAGTLIILEEWQKKSITICFGWQKKRLDKDGNPVIKNGKIEWVRRFNTAFWFISRKNGKSILASGIALAESILTAEIGNQIVSFATKRDQAKIVWNGCAKMIRSNKALNKKSKEAYSTLHILPKDCTIKPLGRDSNTSDGLNVGFGVGDEIHAHPDRSMIEVIESSQGSRINPMMFFVTTAGFDTASVGYQEYDYAKKVLEGTIVDNSYFAFVCELDKDDDPFDESVWYKANPNLGISKSYDYMRKQAKQAQERTETRNNFLVKDLNKWVNADESFISLDEWNACGVDTIDLSDVEMILLGFDLSRSDDFTAVAKTYILSDGRPYTTQHYYIPKDNIQRRAKELRIPLYEWINAGHITATPGVTIDYDYIKKDIVSEIDKGLDAICYDVAFASTLISNIESETNYENCVQIRQGFTTISEPTYNFKDAIKSKKLLHDKNPVTTWMVSNLAVITNSYGNIKPDKSKRNRKIDGAAAIINTFAGALSFKTEDENIYENRGVREL